MLIVPITQREFDLYALSLPRGPNFDPLVFHSAWKAVTGISVAAILKNELGRFDTLVMRRQTDHPAALGPQFGMDARAAIASACVAVDPF